MKRILSSALIAALLLSLAACVGPANTPVPTAAPTAALTAAPTAAPTPEPTPVPTEAPTEAPTNTPDPLAGFDEHDYSVLRDFFELKDENGVTNGEKCFVNYDPASPSTWLDETDGRSNCVYWNQIGKAIAVSLEGTDAEPIILTGSIALSELLYITSFTAWNVVMDTVDANDLHTAETLKLFCLKFPYVNGEASFKGAYVERIYMRSAVRTHVELTGESSFATYLRPSFTIDVTVEGGGFAGVNAWSDENCYEVRLTAEPKEGMTFAGWYDASGHLISKDEVYELFGEDSGNIVDGAHAEFVFVARFENN